MEFDATFWVAVSFFIFIGILIYFKIPQKINELLNNQILNIKKEIDESEKLRNEAKDFLEVTQNKLDSATTEGEKIINQAKKESENLIIEMNDKFHKSAEIKKKLVETKINQMKEAAIKEIKDNSVKIAIESVKKVITTSVDKSKLDTIFEKNLEEVKTQLKKINS
jgi:F-type H+-transporting ATPase subunit b|tara:strand:- start:4278 stop:4775 length:498 start_codon:yes stop_codon:yes gene_type:complete